MITTEPTGTLASAFSSPGATARPWAEVEETIARAEMFWLSTVRRDGRPHVAPLPAIWFEDALHFCTGGEEQKARNLDADARCVLTTGTNAMNAGLDVVVEGAAAAVTDDATLRALAALWKSKLDWDFRATDGGFDGGAGNLVRVFRVRPEKVLAFGKGEPFSQTRYRFAR